MFYYEVLPASYRYHGSNALTYCGPKKLESGQIVEVGLQSSKTLGIVLNTITKKPEFEVKPILQVLESFRIPKQLLALTDWLAEYYPASIGQLTNMLLPGALAQKSRKIQTFNKSESEDVQSLPKLTSDQKSVVEDILKSKQRSHLIHGNTGSGKTRVYLELVKTLRDSGKSSIILTPEIGLTPQLAESAEDVFSSSVVVLHSGLTPAQRRDRWIQIASSPEPLVVIGPRSALFAPVKDLGLIVLDEAHDTAYKQEQAPYYMTSRVAAKLGELHDAKVVLGSATPLVNDYYTFYEKKLPIHRLASQAIPNKHKSNIEIVNLADRSLFSRSKHLSDNLINAIKQSLDRGEQALIFLNRRGSARVILCGSCGWQAVCPRCDVALTYHSDRHRLQCHTCGHVAVAPASCPVCSSTDLTFRSIGTKAVVSEIERLFTKAKIGRFDSDNQKSENLAAMYSSIKKGEIDIIVGTQILAKGLDLPKLGLVAIVLADTGLSFPDYTAEERSYQLLSQVAGRTNRGHIEGLVVVQTYHPDSSTINQALSEDYKSFYEQQLEQRKKFGFPPFRYLLKLEIERASSASAEKATEKLVNQIKSLGLRIEISDGAPAFTEKILNKYRWHVVIKSTQRSQLLELIKQLPSNIRYDIDPINLL
jgi:primosomal protein N' (replication factor Y) (superfamily II helicase)